MSMPLCTLYGYISYASLYSLWLHVYGSILSMVTCLCPSILSMVGCLWFRETPEVLCQFEERMGDINSPVLYLGALVARRRINPESTQGYLNSRIGSWRLFNSKALNLGDYLVSISNLYVICMYHVHCTVSCS